MVGRGYEALGFSGSVVEHGSEAAWPQYDSWDLDSDQKSMQHHTAKYPKTFFPSDQSGTHKPDDQSWELYMLCAPQCVTALTPEDSSPSPSKGIGIGLCRKVMGLPLQDRRTIA